MSKILKALILSGWGHRPEAFDAILPAGGRANYFPYHALQNKTEVLAALEKAKIEADIVIGWSLGGRLAAHAVARQILKPKLLVLIGTSFHSHDKNPVTIQATNDLYAAFEKSPDTARAAFTETMLRGDSRRNEIRASIPLDREHDGDWLRWLKERLFGCEELDYARMPRTLIIHGAKDAVTPPDQAGLFQKHIKDSRLALLPDCGHLPHLHAPDRIGPLIGEELRHA